MLVLVIFKVTYIKVINVIGFCKLTSAWDSTYTVRVFIDDYSKLHQVFYSFKKVRNSSRFCLK